MDVLLKIGFAVAVVFFLPVFSAFFGALAGVAVGLFFEDAIMWSLARFGVSTEGMTMWQLGACLGFVGGFFRTPGSS